MLHTFPNPMKEKQERRERKKKNVKISEPSTSNGLQTRNKTFKINDKYLYDINMYARQLVGIRLVRCSHVKGIRH